MKMEIAQLQYNYNCIELLFLELHFLKCISLTPLYYLVDTEQFLTKEKAN